MSLADVQGAPQDLNDDPFFGDPAAFGGIQSIPGVGAFNAPAAASPAPPQVPYRPPPGPDPMMDQNPAYPTPPPPPVARQPATPPGPAPLGPPAPAPPPPQGIGATPGAILGAPGANAPPQGPISPEQALRMAMQRGGAARPAGYVPESRTNTGTVYSPGTVSAIGESLGAQGDLAGAQLEYERQHGSNQGVADERLAALDQVDAAQEARVRARQQADIVSHYQHVERLQQAAETAGKIDPGRYWKDKGLGAHVGLAIAAALGGFGAALTHTPNSAIEMIKDAQDKDLHAQEVEAQSAKDKVGAARNLYELNLQKYGDADRARLATQLAQRQVTVSQLQAQVSRQDAPAAMRLRAQQIAAPLMKDIADKKQELDEKTVHQVTSEKYQQATVPGGDPLEMLQRAAAIRKAGAELEGTDLGTRTGEAGLQKTEAETAKDQAAAKAASGATGADAFEKAAKNVTSTSIWSDPAKAISQNFQGTEGQQAALQREGYNSVVMSAIMKNHPGLARNKELFGQAVNAYLVHSNDTPETLERKKALARQNLFSGPSAMGVPDGAGAPDIPDE